MSNKKNPFEPESPVEENELDDFSHLDEDAVILETTRESQCDTCKVSVEAEEVRLRALAEMENFKKRVQRDQEERIAYANEKVLADLLPTLDNFDLALQYGSQVDACKDVLMGVEMTRKLLLDTLKNHGLEQLGKEGDEFDPNLHEAMGQEESDSLPPGAIIKVMQRGYKLKDRLLRPAKVIVNSAKAAPGPDAGQAQGGKLLNYKI